ncbi:MAG: FtsW/RodA/SpoVE family cell cycle protein, partial [Acidimicrobiales bacterium]
MRLATHPAPQGAQWSRPARRRSELGMLLMVLALTGGLYVLASLGKGGGLPPHVLPFLGLVLALMVAAHVSLRRLAPQADPVLLPLAALLNGFGYVFISGIDSAQASAQATWTAVAVVCFVATLALFPRAVHFERYRYSVALAGLALLLLPLVPHIGEDVNGARLWVHLGPASFQPEEFAKIALAIFFASVLAERADLLATGTRRIGRWLVLDPRYMAPLIGAWGVSLLVLLAENDLGSSFLFFTLFVGLLWVATGRWAYLGLGAGLFAAGAVFALDVVHHAGTRVQSWLHPWAHFTTSGYQIIEGWFALAAGGLAGLGPGQGNPQVVPEASTDFIFASIGEEVGLIGLTALLIAYLLMIGSGLR